MADMPPAPPAAVSGPTYMALSSYVNRLEDEISSLWTSFHMASASGAAFVLGFILGWLL